MRQALFEEMAGYQAERAFLTDQRRKLECECPYYALHVASQTNISLALGPMALQGHNSLQSGPDYVEIPLKMHDDASVSGEGQGLLVSQSELTAGGAFCEGAGNQSLRIAARGTVDGATDATQLHVKIGSERPPAGSASAVCRAAGRTLQSGPVVTHGEDAAFPFDMPAMVGQTQTLPLQPVAGVEITMGIEIVETAQKSAMTRGEAWQGQTPAPHFLPNCRAAAVTR
jgi:hypothetical protein